MISLSVHDAECVTHLQTNKIIELAGRCCYRSVPASDPDTFIAKLIRSGHLSVLEHGTVYLTLPFDVPEHMVTSPYCKCACDPTGAWHVTTNRRYLIENGWEESMAPYVCKCPSQYHEKRYTQHIIADRGVSAEINRHRHFSISERSTRYVNYTGDLRVVMPPTFTDRDLPDLFLEDQDLYYQYNLDNPGDFNSPVDEWLMANLIAADKYNALISAGWSPQLARRILPLDVETEEYLTAFESDWMYFFDLRLIGTTGAPHPDMRYLAGLMLREMSDNFIANYNSHLREKNLILIKEDDRISVRNLTTGKETEVWSLMVW